MANKIIVVPQPDYTTKTDYGTHGQTVATRERRLGIAHPPSAVIAAAQDPNQTEGDFLRDLGRVTSNRAKERLAGSKDT